jgi:serum/glucocorticoid-regulated kinase 2
LGSPGTGGAASIRNHTFFTEIDWVKLEARQVEPAFKPKVKSATDISQIDTMFTQEKPQDSLVENTGALHDAKDSNFDGFTFVAENHMDK